MDASSRLWSGHGAQRPVSRPGGETASGHRREKPPLFRPLAAGERDLPVRLPQARARAERQGDSSVRPADRKTGERNRQTARAGETPVSTGVRRAGEVTREKEARKGAKYAKERQEGSQQ